MKEAVVMRKSLSRDLSLPNSGTKFTIIVIAFSASYFRIKCF